MSDLKDLQKDIDSAIYSAYQFGRVNDPKQNTPFTGDMAVQMVNEIVKAAPSLVSTSGGTPSIYGDSQMNLSFDRYYAHPSYSTLGFSPWRDNEGLYNDQSSWVDDLGRGLKTTGAIIGSTMWNNKPFLSTLDLFDPLNYEEEHANELSRLMKIGTSTRGGLGGFATNFFVNSGITLGIVGSAIIENMAIGAISAGMASTGVGAAPGAATFAMGTAATVAKAGARFSKMMGTLKLLSNVGKNADNLKRVFDFSKQAQRLGTLADNAVVDFFNPMSNVFKLAKEAPETFKGLNALGKSSQTFGAFYRDARNMAMVVNEAQLEGGLVINQMMEDFIRSEYDRTGEYPSLERMEEARNAAQEAAFYTTMINLPLIHFSNKVVLDNILNSSKSVSTILKEIEVGKVLGNFVKSPEGYKYLAPGFKNITHTLRPARMAGHLLNYSRKNFMEAIQENAQEATSAGVINYYSNILNNPYVDQSQLLRDSIHKGIGEQFTGQGLETFFSGFLTGGLIGGIGNILTFGADKYKQLYQKEKWDKYVTERDAYINDVESSLNFLDKNLLDLGTGFDDILSPTLVDAAQQSAVANGISRSTSENNVNVQKNLQDLALYEHVYNALRVGKFDEIMSSYKDLLSLNDQDLLNAFPDKGMTASEIRNKLNTTIQRGNRIKERFDKYASYENPISVANMDRSDSAYPKMVAKRNAIETVRKLLIMSEEDYTRGVERMSDITNSLMEVLPSIADANSDEILSFLDPDVKLNAVLLHRLKTELQTLQDTLKTGVLSAEDKALVDKKVDFLNKQVAAVVVLDAKLRNFRASFRNNKEFSKDEREELLKVYKNYIQVLGGKPGALGVITNDQALNKSLEYILDYIVLTEENKVLGAAINVMQDPKGFATTSNAVTDYFESILQNSAFMSSLYKRAIAMNEENALYNYIFNKYNLFVHPTEEELYFVDAITEKVIDETDPRYESAEKDYYEFREKVSSQEAQKEKATRAEVKLKRESFRKEAKDKLIDSILENYPQLTREQIQDALDSGTLDELLNVDSNVFALKEIMGVNPDSETASISFLLEQNLIPEEAYAVLETIRDNMSYLYLTDDVISKLKEKIKSDPGNKAFYEEQINSIKSKLSELNLKSAYFNIATGKYYTRTTDYIKPGEKSPPSADSAKKGNAVDAYVRDFFANPENRDDNKRGYTKLYDYLVEFEKAAKVRGEYIIPTGITLFDDVLGVAGTVDILTVDKDGKFRIYDVKTSDKDYLANTVGKDGVLEYDVIQKDGMSIRESHSRQLNTYRELLETYGDNVEVIGLQIIRVKRDKSSREGSRDSYRALSPVDVTIGNVEDITLVPGSESEVVTETQGEETSTDAETPSETVVTEEAVVESDTAKSEVKVSSKKSTFNMISLFNGVPQRIRKGRIVAKVSYNPELGKFEYWNESGTEELNPRQQTIIAKHLFSKNPTYLFRFWYENITSKNTEIRSRLNTLYEEYEVSKSENRLDGEVLFAKDALLIRNALYGKLIVEDKDKSEFGADNNLKRNSWFASQGVRGITIDQFVVDMMAEAYAQGDWYDLVGKKDELELTEYIKEVIRDSQGYTLKQLKDLANRTIDNTFDVEFLSQFGIPLSAIEKNKSLFWNQEPTSVNTAYEGKLVYGTPGSGKTYFVANNTDNNNIVDVDNLLLTQLEALDREYDFAKGLSFTNENLAELILKYGNATGKKKEEDYDPELYDPVRKEINSLKAQGKILLTGTLRFILEADVVVVAEDRESKMRSKLSSDGNMSNERIAKYKERENKRGAVIVLPAGKYIDYVLYRNPSELIDSEGIAKIQQAKIDSVKYDPYYAKSYFDIISQKEIGQNLKLLNNSFTLDTYEAAQISKFYEKFIGKTLKSLSPEDQNLIMQPGVALIDSKSDFSNAVVISEVSLEDDDYVIQTAYFETEKGTRNFSSKSPFIKAYSDYTISFGTRPIEGGSGADVNTGNNDMPNTITDDDIDPPCTPF